MMSLEDIKDANSLSPIKRRKLIIHQVIHGFMIWHPDPEQRKKFLGLAGNCDFSILLIFPTFEDALNEMLECDGQNLDIYTYEIISESDNRRLKINWLDENGWRIKQVKVTYE